MVAQVAQQGQLRFLLFRNGTVWPGSHPGKLALTWRLGWAGSSLTCACPGVLSRFIFPLSSNQREEEKRLRSDHGCLLKPHPGGAAEAAVAAGRRVHAQLPADPGGLGQQQEADGARGEWLLTAREHSPAGRVWSGRLLPASP